MSVSSVRGTAVIGFSAISPLFPKHPLRGSPRSVPSFLPSYSSLQSSHSVLESSAQRACPLGASQALPAPSHPIFLPRVWSLIAIEAPAGVDGTVPRACSSPGPGIQQEAHLAVRPFSPIQLSPMQLKAIQLNSCQRHERARGSLGRAPAHGKQAWGRGWRDAAH